MEAVDTTWQIKKRVHTKGKRAANDRADIAGVLQPIEDDNAFAMFEIRRFWH